MKREAVARIPPGLDVEGLSGKRQTRAVSWHLSLQIVVLTRACLTISNLGVEEQKGPKLTPPFPFTRKSEGLDLGAVSGKSRVSVVVHCYSL